MIITQYPFVDNIVHPYKNLIQREILVLSKQYPFAKYWAYINIFENNIHADIVSPFVHIS